MPPKQCNPYLLSRNFCKIFLKPNQMILSMNIYVKITTFTVTKSFKTQKSPTEKKLVMHETFLHFKEFCPLRNFLRNIFFSQ